MLTSYTTVVERRTSFTSERGTVPYEAGWASEALFFVQAEGGHPELTLTPEISPDGMSWVATGDPVVLGSEETLAAVPVTHFGAWLRLRVEGPTADQPVVLLVHLSLKG